MRKITENSVEAFMSSKSFKKDNTSVVMNGNHMAYFLHNNLIATKEHITNTIEVSLAGWNTNTTRERLNGIPGVNISTRKGQAFLNGNPIENNKFYTI